VYFVPPRRAVSATLAFKNPAGATLSSPACTLDSVSRTLASVADFSFTVASGAGTLAPNVPYWLGITGKGEELITLSSVDGVTCQYISKPAVTPAVSATLKGARFSATIADTETTILDQYYQLAWTVTFADGAIETFLESACVCRRVFYPPMTASEAARHASFAFPNVASARPAQYWQEVSNRSNARVEKRILASGRFPHLVGDQSLLRDAGFVAMRIELARDGMIPAGFDGSAFLTQMETELKMELDLALSSTWNDKNDDGKVDVDEMGGPRTIRLVRV
jgi:hypothetical protein